MDLENYIDNKILLTNSKTKDYDKLAKQMIKEKIDVSSLEKVILDKQQYHRIFFQVSLGQIENYKDQFIFIEKHADKLKDWWHVDNLLQFVHKNNDFKFALNKAKQYITSNNLFLRRWGYVLFLLDYYKNEDNFNDIVALLKDDNDYYVVMAEAWLISYLAIYYPDKTYNFISNSKIKYNIIGRGIQKICDSYRISDEHKNKFKSLRGKLKAN